MSITGYDELVGLPVVCRIDGPLYGRQIGIITAASVCYVDEDGDITHNRQDVELSLKINDKSVIDALVTDDDLINFSVGE